MKQENAILRSFGLLALVTAGLSACSTPQPLCNRAAQDWNKFETQEDACRGIRNVTTTLSTGAAGGSFGAAPDPSDFQTTAIGGETAEGEVVQPDPVEPPDQPTPQQELEPETETGPTPEEEPEPEPDPGPVKPTKPGPPPGF